MVDLGHRVVVLAPEEPRVSSEDEVKEYAIFLGIDVDTEPQLMWIAREGVAAPVPHPWKACHNLDAEHEDEIFYFNFESAESVWDHPCDEKYRSMVEDARTEYEAMLSGNRLSVGGTSRVAAELLRSSSFGGGSPDSLEALLSGGGAAAWRENGDAAAGILGGPAVMLDNIEEEDEESSSYEAPAKARASGLVKQEKEEEEEEEEEEEYEEDYDEDSRDAPGGQEDGDSVDGKDSATASTPRGSDSRSTTAAPSAGAGDLGGGASLPGDKTGGQACRDLEEVTSGGADVVPKGDHDRVHCLHVKIESLSRCLAMLQDIRSKQQEYLRVLETGV